MQYVKGKQGPCERHQLDWHTCKKCPLHKQRHNVVLWRGYVPCDVLLIGEAPGDVENNHGYPFIGPAGDQLNNIIQSAEDELGFAFRFAITNTVACIPCGPNGSLREPNEEETKACEPRLTDFFRIAEPKAVVCLGEIAKKIPAFSVPVFHTIHPSAILRDQTTGIVKFRKILSTVINAVEEIRQ